MVGQYATVWNVSRLSREDWAKAALEAISSGGVSAVAVEPIAARLGTTKGSFYWHFKARGDLVEAALVLWERRSTLDVIAAVEQAGGSPKARLRRLFGRVFEPEALTHADVSLHADAAEPAVRDVLRRVTRHRIDYVTALLRECGHGPRASRRRALFAYSAFLGNIQLMRSAPDLLESSVGSLSRYADEVVEALVRTTR